MTTVCICKVGVRTCSWVEGQRAEVVPGQPHTLGLLDSRQDPWVPLCEGPSSAYRGRACLPHVDPMCKDRPPFLLALADSRQSWCTGLRELGPDPAEEAPG